MQQLTPLYLEGDGDPVMDQIEERAAMAHRRSELRARLSEADRRIGDCDGNEEDNKKPPCKPILAPGEELQ